MLSEYQIKKDGMGAACSTYRERREVVHEEFWWGKLIE
jgi:hypothetical protein